MSERIIRPSSLADFLDCPRRFAARHLADMLASAGYEVAGRREGHVGAAVGTGLHAYAGHVLTIRLAKGNDPAPSDAQEIAITEMRERMSVEGCMWDEVTGDLNTAEKQLRRMNLSWHQHLAPTYRPQLVEQRLECIVSDGVAMSGQMDVVDTLGNGVRIRDNKTTKVKRAAHVQLGAYGLILHSHGYDLQGLAIDHIPRVRLRDEQPAPVTREVPLRGAIEDAMQAVQDVGRTIDLFRQRAADPAGMQPISAFSANPSSMLCNDKWCPAHGTATCRAHVIA